MTAIGGRNCASSKCRTFIIFLIELFLIIYTISKIIIKFVSIWIRLNPNLNKRVDLIKRYHLT
jgi:hypothetical protein